jgi:hypothetical protein
MRKRSKSPKRLGSSPISNDHKHLVHGGQRTNPKAALDFSLIGRSTAGNPADDAPRSPPFAANHISSPPNTPFSSPLDSGFGHDKYLIFFYRPHFISAFVGGAGQSFEFSFTHTLHQSSHFLSKPLTDILLFS